MKATQCHSEYGHHLGRSMQVKRGELIPLSTTLIISSLRRVSFFHYVFSYYRFLSISIIMEHGGDQLDQSTTSSFEIITGPGNGGTPQVVVEANNSSPQEEKERVFKRVEHEMEVFRKGECSRFQASSRVASELEKWGGASDKEKGKAFDSYLAEINSFATVQDDNRSHTRGSSPPPGTVE